MNNRTNRKRRRFCRPAILLCLLAALLCAAASHAGAVGTIDTGKTCSMTFACSYDGDALPGMVFRLYYVAEETEANVFTLAGDFKDYAVNLKNLDASGWEAAANTLATYVRSDDLSALGSGTSDAGGAVSFEHLSVGLYLAVGERLTIGRRVYSADPFLVALPGLGDDGAWLYDLDVLPKLSAVTRPPRNDDQPETEQISVIKLWNDEGSEDLRPAGIEATLLRDGDAYDTVTLTEDNYWRHTWTGLSADSEWLVVEENVPEDYTVTYDAEGTTLTITNAYLEQIEEPPVPGAPGANTDETEIAETEDAQTLPQTGMLWWPVHVMAALGIALFALGWRLSFRGRRKHEGR